MIWLIELSYDGCPPGQQWMTLKCDEQTALDAAAPYKDDAVVTLIDCELIEQKGDWNFNVPSFRLNYNQALQQDPHGRKYALVRPPDLAGCIDVFWPAIGNQDTEEACREWIARFPDEYSSYLILKTNNARRIL